MLLMPGTGTTSPPQTLSRKEVLPDVYPVVPPACVRRKLYGFVVTLPKRLVRVTDSRLSALASPCTVNCWEKVNWPPYWEADAGSWNQVLNMLSTETVTSGVCKVAPPEAENRNTA